MLLEINEQGIGYVPNRGQFPKTSPYYTGTMKPDALCHVSGIDFMTMTQTPIGRLRLVGMLEGLSFLILLGIAMPLKYMWGQPLAVRFVGMIHGVLFIWFCGVLLNAKDAAGWNLKKSGRILLAALLPFGPFVIDGSLRREDEVLKGG